jgi:hypothetical protein
MAVLITALLLGISTGAAAQVDCSTHKIFCAIKTINPRVESGFAMELSNYIYKYSKKYGTNPYRTVAIIAQESMFQQVNTEIDFGIYQLNEHTMRAYNIDKEKVLTDLEYATHKHIWLLKKKKEYCINLEEESWSCYHSATEKHRKKYVKLVNRYYNKIREVQ